MSKVKGATHYAVKQVQKLATGGPVDAPSNIVKTELMPSGAQQYVRGKSVGDKMRTSNGLNAQLDEADRKATGMTRPTWGESRRRAWYKSTL